MTDEQINAAIEERDIARADLEKVVGYNTKLRKELDEALALVKREKTRVDGHYENYCEILKRIDVVLNERDEARDEVERLRKALGLSTRLKAQTHSLQQQGRGNDRRTN